MKKHKKKIKVKRKTNFWVILLGIFIISLFLFLANLIYTHRQVRMTGQYISCPLIEITYGSKGGNSGSVLLDGNIISVWSIDDDLKVGDSIQVRYDKTRAIAVQEKFDEKSFLIFFALDSVLLFLGLALLYAGITGRGYP